MPPDSDSGALEGNAPSGGALACSQRPGLEDRKAGRDGPGTEGKPLFLLYLPRVLRSVRMMSIVVDDVAPAFKRTF